VWKLAVLGSWEMGWKAVSLLQLFSENSALVFALNAALFAGTGRGIGG
jgi:hypothetical protein